MLAASPRCPLEEAPVEAAIILEMADERIGVAGRVLMLPKACWKNSSPVKYWKYGLSTALVP
jgi:hypothetical protein